MIRAGFEFGLGVLLLVGALMAIYFAVLTVWFLAMMLWWGLCKAWEAVAS